MPLVRERETLRLGDIVASERVIGRAAADEAIAVVARFKAIAEMNGADEIIALGTSAIREALDGGSVVDRVKTETGVKIHVVDGTREAELIFKAVEGSSPIRVASGSTRPRGVDVPADKASIRALTDLRCGSRPPPDPAATACRCKDHLPGHFQVATMRWWSGARGHHSPRLPQVRT